MHASAAVSVVNSFARSDELDLPFSSLVTLRTALRTGLSPPAAILFEAHRNRTVPDRPGRSSALRRRMRLSVRASRAEVTDECAPLSRGDLNQRVVTREIITSPVGPRATASAGRPSCRRRRAGSSDKRYPAAQLAYQPGLPTSVVADENSTKWSR